VGRAFLSVQPILGGSPPRGRAESKTDSDLIEFASGADQESFYDMEGLLS
jgi:hypothetical protein